MPKEEKKVRIVKTDINMGTYTIKKGSVVPLLKTFSDVDIKVFEEAGYFEKFPLLAEDVINPVPEPIIVKNDYINTNTTKIQYTEEELDIPDRTYPKAMKFLKELEYQYLTDKVDLEKIERMISREKSRGEKASDKFLEKLMNISMAKKK